VADVVRCFTALEDGSAQVAYGTRAHAQSSFTRSQPVHRIAAGRTYNLVLRGLGLTGERDTQCGLKGFTALAADEIFEPLQTPGFGFDIEVLARAARGGWRIQPLSVRWSHVGASRVRPVRDGWNMGWSAVRVAARLAREGRATVDGARATRTAQ
jgi:dolichyl-phosphate beta-glucosyltransferase